MGIRIHKLLGYGLDDVKSDHYSIKDDRFTKKFINQYFETGFFEFKVKDYRDWLTKRSDHESRYEKLCLEKTDSCLSYCFNYQGEYGLPNIFLVIPPVFVSEWRRYDDIIDYYDEYVKEPKITNWYKVIPCGIFPFNMYGYKNFEIPQCVKNICAYFKVFKNKKTIKEFKPMIYNYWS